jgi:hypothetical protein
LTIAAGEITPPAIAIAIAIAIAVPGVWKPHGPQDVAFYTRLKTVTGRWPAGIRAGAENMMPTMC